MPKEATGAQDEMVLPAQMLVIVAEAGMIRNAEAKIVTIKIAAKDPVVLILARCHPLACLVLNGTTAPCSGAIKSCFLKLWLNSYISIILIIII